MCTELLCPTGLLRALMLNPMGLVSIKFLDWAGVKMINTRYQVKLKVSICESHYIVCVCVLATYRGPKYSFY